MEQKYKLWVDDDDDVGLSLCYVTSRHVTSRHVTSRHVTSINDEQRYCRSSQLNVAKDFCSNDAGVWLFLNSKGKGKENEPSKNYQPYFTVIPLRNKNVFISVKPYKVKYITYINFKPLNLKIHAKSYMSFQLIENS
jgi:hypothetical protein